MEWYGTILPRIHRYIPVGTILEIACGYGRWTHYLKDSCQKLVAIDLLDECIEACKARFAAYPHVTCLANDGKCLEIVPNNSVDFVFSFDSLVHVDPGVMRAYVSQLPRILSARGVAFLHHSNLGEYSYYRTIERIPKLLGLLWRMGILEKNLHNRDRVVSARLVRQLAEDHGLKCISQELVGWSTRSALIDCFTVVVRKDRSGAQDDVVLRNSQFMQEVRRCSMLSRLYGREDFKELPIGGRAVEVRTD